MSQAQLQMIADLEMEMMSDMYRRMTTACQQKCISTRYKEAELTKGEAVCLDRCVAKYLDVHEKLGKRLTSISQQDEKQLQQMQQQLQLQQQAK
ncbi:Mitochondrial import inner membrane translocase subunit Tim10 [Acanthocheilonema viteae]